MAAASLGELTVSALARATRGRQRAAVRRGRVDRARIAGRGRRAARADQRPARRADADTGGARTTPARQLRPRRRPTKALEELLDELDALVGLEAVKTEVRHQTQVLRIQALRGSKGLRNPELTRHLVFVGNPGTGKTTVARLVAAIYQAVGLLPEADTSSSATARSSSPATSARPRSRPPRSSPPRSVARSSSTRPTRWRATNSAPRRSIRSSRRWKTTATSCS